MRQTAEEDAAVLAEFDEKRAGALEVFGEWARMKEEAREMIRAGTHKIVRVKGRDGRYEDALVPA